MTTQGNAALSPEIKSAISDLVAQQQSWAKTSVEERMQILLEIKDKTMQVAEAWATKAAQMKNIPNGSPLRGEEWLSGPYTLLAACNGLLTTLSQLEGKSFLKRMPIRETASGQVAASVIPHSIWDHLLLSGVHAEIWMQPGVTKSNLAANTASAYDTPPNERKGGLGLVLGAGNIAAITPLDCLHKLYLEHSVVILKMNPVNDYLTEFFEVALAPLISRGALRIVGGGGDVGAALCTHPEVKTIHITGAKATHDLIVWGAGEEGEANKRAGTPINDREIASELGGVCPTIVVPGNWSRADLRFQARHVATQKLHNSGCNCVASQVLLLPKGWKQLPDFLAELKLALKSAPKREPYYPGYEDRMQAVKEKHAGVENHSGEGVDRYLVDLDESQHAESFYADEVFASALGIKLLDASEPKQFLKQAIAFSNEQLFGTLGGNIIIDPNTKKSMKAEWDQILADFKYGTIAVNAWTGLGFLSPVCGWGGFPGHTLADAGSGVGVVHNTYMFDKLERTIVEAPFRPFPRNLLHGSMTLLPNPPWFVHNPKGDILGRLLTRFQHTPSWFKLPRIFLNALLG